MTPRFPIRIACAAVLAASFGLTGSAFAASKTGTLNVKLTIEDGCSVFTSSAAGTLDFGTWTTLSDTIDQSTTFNVSCSGINKAVKVGLDGGLSGDVSSRKLYLSGDKAKAAISYSLYSDIGRTINWGDTGTSVVERTSGKAGENLAFTVYGRVLAQSAIPGVGVYTDTVKVSITAN